MLAALLLLQATAPDIQIDARVRARSLTIEKRGDAQLVVRTQPEGANRVDVRAPQANGRRTVRNFEATVRAQARIADPAAATATSGNQ
jgi:hypothetical protein